MTPILFCILLILLILLLQKIHRFLEWCLANINDGYFWVIVFWMIFTPFIFLASIFKENLYYFYKTNKIMILSSKQM